MELGKDVSLQKFEEGAKVEESTPLHKAARNEDAAELRRLLTEGFPVNALDSEGSTPFLTTFSNTFCNRLEIVQTLVNFGADVNVVTKDGCLNALQVCCFRKPPDFLQVMEYLMSVGAKVDVRTEPKKRNLIHLAALRLNAIEYHQFLKLMINKGYQGLMLEPDHLGTTPLHMATRLDLLPETLQLYHDNGANFNAQNYAGLTPLDLAENNKRSEEFLKNLRNFGASLNTNKTSDHPKTYTFSPLDMEWKLKLTEVYGKIEANPDLTQVLLDELNVEWTSRNKRGGNSLLHAAVIYRNDKLARLLLTKGFNANAVGNTGYTPMQLCLENNWNEALEMVEILLENGAHVDFKETHKYSCFYLCTLRKPPDWMQVFHCLLQRTNDTDGAMEIARGNLTLEEFNKLEGYRQLKKDEK